MCDALGLTLIQSKVSIHTTCRLWTTTPHGLAPLEIPTPRARGLEDK
jgi:hypothetical protein